MVTALMPIQMVISMKASGQTTQSTVMYPFNSLYVIGMQSTIPTLILSKGKYYYSDGNVFEGEWRYDERSDLEEVNG